MLEFLSRKGFLSVGEPLAVPPSLGRRILGMCSLWLLVGVVVGLLGAAPHSDTIALLSNVLAGMLLVPPLGLALGIIGGQWRESLMGGLFGTASGMILAMVLPGGMAAGAIVSVCLLVGGMSGATLPLFFRLLKRLAASPAR